MSIDTFLSKPNTSYWEELQWEPSQTQLDQFIQLQSLLDYWNKKVNLTRLIHGNDFWISQVSDSLSAFKEELKSPYRHRKCIDIGSGCGFPGFAVAISMPGSHLTLVDAVRKKTTALQEISKELGLSNRIKIRNERVELTGQNELFRGKFDLAMARAVASSSVVAEYLIPFLNRNGEAIFYRGKWDDLEQSNLINTLLILNAKLVKVDSYKLPEERGIRHIIRASINGICPKRFPRAIGKPCKSPLGL